MRRGKIGEGLDRIKWKNGKWMWTRQERGRGSVGDGREARRDGKDRLKSGMQVQVQEWVVLAGPYAIRYGSNEDEQRVAHLEEPSSFNRRTLSDSPLAPHRNPSRMRANLGEAPR